MRTYKSKSVMVMLLAGAAAVMSPQKAQALNTAACTPISNSATVDYNVGAGAGVPQAQKTSNIATFYVGNKVNLTVTREDTSYVIVTPGQTNATLTYKITNLGNTHQIYHLTQANSAVPAAWTTADNYDATSPTIYVQNAVNLAVGGGSYAAGTTTVVLAPNDYIYAQIRSEIPTVPATPVLNGGYNEDDVSAHSLIATTFNADDSALTELDGTVKAGPAGATTCTNAQGAFVVFADGVPTLPTDDDTLAKDGKASNRDAYKTTSPNLTISKTSVVYSDPVNGTTTPKAIPGAIVLYTITITNSGTADAKAVTVADSLAGMAASLSFVTQYNDGVAPSNPCAVGSGIVIKEGAAAATCRTNDTDAEGSPLANFTTNVVNAGPMTVPAGTTTTIKFQAEIL